MKISVAICTYNGEKYIADELSSIITQTILPDEIVICDDNSTDRTIEICNTFATKTKTKFNIIINTKNKGVVENFRQAISLCTGDYIFLADQDDIWIPQKIDIIIDYFNNNPNVDTIFTDAHLIGAQGESLDKYSLWDTIGFSSIVKKQFTKGYGLEIIAHDNIATGATMCIKRNAKNIFINTKIYSNNIYHDAILLGLAVERHTIGFINKKTIYYRIHPKQVVGIGGQYFHPTKRSAYKKREKKNTWLEAIPLSTKSIQRINFQYERSLYKGIAILSNIKKYKVFYNKVWPLFVLYDIAHMVYYKYNQIKRTIHQSITHMQA